MLKSIYFLPTMNLLFKYCHVMKIQTIKDITLDFRRMSAFCTSPKRCSSRPGTFDVFKRRQHPLHSLSQPHWRALSLTSVRPLHLKARCSRHLPTTKTSSLICRKSNRILLNDQCLRLCCSPPNTKMPFNAIIINSSQRRSTSCSQVWTTN